MVSSNGVGRANVRRAYDNEEVGDVGGAGAGRRRPQARDPSLGVRSFGAPSQDPLSVRLLPSGEFVAISPVSRENIAYFLVFSRLYYLFFLNVFFLPILFPFFIQLEKAVYVFICISERGILNILRVVSWAVSNTVG